MKNKLLVLSAKWCRPCCQLKAALKEFNATHEPKIDYDVVDIEEQTEFVKAYDIQSVPILIFRYENDGPDYFVHVGTATIQQILDKLKQ